MRVTVDGGRMPAEWEPHAGCLMQWPCRPDLWGRQLEAAMVEYAGVACAISEFEPVLMICPPGHGDEVTERCGREVRPVEFPIDDSWARDSGPLFVTAPTGDWAVAGFQFNAWGNRWQPHDSDAALGQRLAEWLGIEYRPVPMVLEGGSFFVDGEGTLLTTEQCLLHPNRNPTMSRAEIEDTLSGALGVSTIVWLPFGHSLDTGPAGTDGHIDGVAQFVGPATVMLEVVTDESSPEYERGRANLAVLESSRDARGRAFVIEQLDPGPASTVSYANHYLAHGAVIVPVSGQHQTDDAALARLTEIYPTRRIVPVTATVIADGGGGPHCITQQIPQGIDVPA